LFNSPDTNNAITSRSGGVSTASLHRTHWPS
jgi:hypothetical protein